MAWHNDQVSDAETARILAEARACLGLPGDFVEFGCFRGDTSILLAELLAGREDPAFPQRAPSVSQPNPAAARPDSTIPRLNSGAAHSDSAASRQQLWLYDSFAGLPEKEPADTSVAGAAFTPGVLATSKRELKQRFLRSSLSLPHIVKGWFSDLTPADLPPQIAFAFLDGDFYRSTLDGLRLIWPRLVPGGRLLVHDYQNEALPGVAQAVTDFFASADFQRSQTKTSVAASQGSQAQTEVSAAPPTLTVFETLAIISPKSPH